MGWQGNAVPARPACPYGRLVEPDDADDGVKDTDMTQHDVDADVRAEAHRVAEDSGESPSRPACTERSTRDSQRGDHVDFPCGRRRSAELKQVSGLMKIRADPPPWRVNAIRPRRRR